MRRRRGARQSRPCGRWVHSPPVEADCSVGRGEDRLAVEASTVLSNPFFATPAANEVATCLGTASCRLEGQKFIMNRVWRRMLTLPLKSQTPLVSAQLS